MDDLEWQYNKELLNTYEITLEQGIINCKESFNDKQIEVLEKIFQYSIENIRESIQSAEQIMKRSQNIDNLYTVLASQDSNQNNGKFIKIDEDQQSNQKEQIQQNKSQQEPQEIIIDE